MSAQLTGHLRAHSAYLDTDRYRSILGSQSDKFGTSTSEVSSKILRALRTNMSVYALMTHIMTQPHVPAVAAIEPILLAEIGEGAFTDDMKQYTGWRVRQIIEALGGSWVRAGVRIRGSRYKSGSIYSCI